MVNVPAGVILPIEPVRFPWVNHRFPSGPAVIREGSVTPGSVKVATTPAVVIRPIEPLLVNHRFPSGPATIPKGLLMPGP